VNEHLKVIGEKLKIEGLTFYAARHSWATIARNNCGVSMDDVAMCLNHKSGYNTTDQYVKKDWSIIDNANRKVIDYLNDCKIAGTV
jgi:integrase